MGTVLRTKLFSRAFCACTIKFERSKIPWFWKQIWVQFFVTAQETAKTLITGRLMIWNALKIHPFSRTSDKGRSHSNKIAHSIEPLSARKAPLRVFFCTQNGIFCCLTGVFKILIALKKSSLRKKTEKHKKIALKNHDSVLKKHNAVLKKTWCGTQTKMVKSVSDRWTSCLHSNIRSIVQVVQIGIVLIHDGNCVGVVVLTATVLQYPF